jgi:nudix motif 8
MSDETDKDALATALRETEEEVFVPKESVEVLGALSPLPNKDFNIEVTPFVGFLGILDPKLFRWNTDEVEMIFTVPVKELMDAKNQDFETFKVSRFDVPSWKIREHTIWGLTAFVLWDFLQNVVHTTHSKL